jgi:hypothetical protein
MILALALVSPYDRQLITHLHTVVSQRMELEEEVIQ